MKAILVDEKSLKDIENMYGKAYVRMLRRRMEVAGKLETHLFFIPYYLHPLCSGIPRDYIVSEQHLMKYFFPTTYDTHSNWMGIYPRAQKLLAA